MLILIFRTRLHKPMGDITVTVQLLYYTLKAGLSGSLRRCRFLHFHISFIFFFYVATLSQQQHKARNRKMGATANLPLSENRKICPQSPLNHLLSPLIKLCLFNLYNKYTHCCFIIQAHFWFVSWWKGPRIALIRCTKHLNSSSLQISELLNQCVLQTLHRKRMISGWDRSYNLSGKQLSEFPKMMINFFKREHN